MHAKTDLIRRILELDRELSNAGAWLSEEKQDFALDACAEIMVFAAAADECDICETLDALIRRHGLERRALQRIRTKN